MISRYSFVKSLSAFAFAVLGLSLVQDAFAAITCRSSTGARACTNNAVCPTGWTKISTSCSTQTVGGSITYISHHGQAIKCTWTEFQGQWSSEPGVPGDLNKPIRVTQEVVGAGNYATCSGWNQTGTSSPPVPFLPEHHADAPYGSGKFDFSVKYESTAPLACEDANSGIGNNCGTFTDLQNPKHKPGDTSTAFALRTCRDSSSNPPVVGTELNYTFACGNGVKVEGFLTLKELITTAIPDFTGPCSQTRFEAGACTMQLGGIPGKYVTKGKTTTFVVDTTACNTAFPSVASVPNALDSGQIQPMTVGQLLVYKEVSTVGSCDPTTRLPTLPELSPPTSYVKGTPKEAYARYCQSDVGLFSDNTNLVNGGGIFTGDLPSPGEGFDNQLRICGITSTQKVLHTGTQDVEKIKLGNNDILATIDQGTINVACGGAGDLNAGKLQVTIPDQVSLANTDILISPLSAAPKLEGIAPIEAPIQNFVISTVPLKYGLRLVYRRCPELAAAIRVHNPTNPPTVTLHLSGTTVQNPAGSFPFDFTTDFPNISIVQW